MGCRGIPRPRGDRSSVDRDRGPGVYERDLRRGINRFRWVEYSFSATLMIVLISFYAGITLINAVIAIAGANVAMI